MGGEHAPVASTFVPNSPRRVHAFLEQVVAAVGQEGLSPSLTTDAALAQSIVDTLEPIADVGGLTIEWATINGRRVDLGATAGGREWRLAMSIDGKGVHSALVLERPELFRGVPGGRAVIVNGPSSVGKTTVMTTIVESSPTPWVMFDELSFGTLKFPFLVWRDRAPTLTPGFVAGIAALAAAGNQVILSSSGNGSPMFDGMRSTVPALSVALDCPLEVLIERQSKRTDRWGGLTESTQRNHEGWTYDLRFDTSRVSADDIAAEILRAVAR